MCGINVKNSYKKKKKKKKKIDIQKKKEIHFRRNVIQKADLTKPNLNPDDARLQSWSAANQDSKRNLNFDSSICNSFFKKKSLTRVSLNTNKTNDKHL